MNSGRVGNNIFCTIVLARSMLYHEDKRQVETTPGLSLFSNLFLQEKEEKVVSC